jgi:DNA-binding SARP family transcriptional activator
LEAEIEVSAAQALVRRCRLVPTDPPLAVQEWPWMIKIYTLGRFSVERDGVPLSFPGKMPRRPLQLLKALIACGGRDVGQAQLIDALWPESEGDAAHRSLATTLYRLRKLLGYDDVIVLRDGRLSLSRYLCWVDVWAFEMLLVGVGQTDEIHGERIERGLALYEGPFLVGEQAPWALLPRERLRTRFLSAVAAMGRHWERGQAWERAIVAYQEGLEVDDLSEWLYCQIMRCYQRLGRNGDAVRVYHRCREALETVLGVGPSVEIERLYQRLRA